VKHNNEEWEFDNDSEFYSEYKGNVQYASFAKSLTDGSTLLVVFGYPHETTVFMESEDRSVIQETFDVFDSHAEEFKMPVPNFPELEPSQKPVIFIGHGRAPLWRELKDHLQDKQGYEVRAYESGEWAGYSVKEVLEEMMEESSFALLVMTGEDETAEGALRARDNVIHETGLFQGKLGFNRAIVLLEEGVEEFSNILGINQIRFSRGNIRETFGDVLATLRREFGEVGS
jgi:hypothetical protein